MNTQLVSAALLHTRRAQRQTLEHLEDAREAVDTWYTGVGSVLPFYPEVRGELLLQAGRYADEIVDISAKRERRHIPFIGCGTGGSSALGLTKLRVTLHGAVY